MEKKNRMEALLRQYEKAYRKKDSNPEAYAEATEQLAVAVAYSVVKKCIDPQRKTAVDRETVSDCGVSPVMVAVKSDLARAIALTHSAREGNETELKTFHNLEGDKVVEVINEDAITAIEVYAHTDMGTGLDLAQTAVVALLEEAQKAEETGRVNNDCWLEAEYEQNRLDKRVIIQSTDSAKWKKVTTSAIVNVFNAVRQEVENTQAVRSASDRFMYLSDLVTDPEGKEEQQIYYRLQKYSDMGNCETVGGRYTADWQTVEEITEGVANLHLTKRQYEVLSYRLQGHGLKAIASKLGVSHQAIAKTLAQVQKKAVAYGLTVDK